MYRSLGVPLFEVAATSQVTVFRLFSVAAHVSCFEDYAAFSKRHCKKVWLPTAGDLFSTRALCLALPLKAVTR